MTALGNFASASRQVSSSRAHASSYRSCGRRDGNVDARRVERVINLARQSLCIGTFALPRDAMQLFDDRPRQLTEERASERHPPSSGFDPFVQAAREEDRRFPPSLRPVSQAMNLKRDSELFDEAITGEFHERQS